MKNGFMLMSLFVVAVMASSASLFCWDDYEARCYNHFMSDESSFMMDMEGESCDGSCDEEIIIDAE
ncbi:MAG TPA: hypothetical protein VKR54_05235 [Candidatus Babeliales bacterium]|nr:hypothetical protein [Candidatus Babeliales bacterium]